MLIVGLSLPNKVGVLLLLLSTAAAFSRGLLFTPDIGIVVLTISVLLIFLELNRPGLVIPGALGLLGVLVSISSWRQWSLSAPALLLLVVAAVLPVWQLRHSFSLWGAVASSIAFSVAFACLIAGPATAHVHPAVAALCGTTLGTAGFLLARIARRARQNKGLD